MMASRRERKNKSMNAGEDTTFSGDSPLCHAIAGDEVLRRLGSNDQMGLATPEVARRIEKYGLNKLPKTGGRGPLVRFLRQCNNILVYALLAAGFVELMLGLWLDAQPNQA
jgi:magnesium-transporting ATPase (P-type)